MACSPDVGHEDLEGVGSVIEHGLVEGRIRGDLEVLGHDLAPDLPPNISSVRMRKMGRKTSSFWIAASMHGWENLRALTGPYCTNPLANSW